MAMGHSLTAAVFIFFLGSVASAEVRTREVIYEAGGVDLKGFLAWDDEGKGLRPGVLVVHEWWGVNDYVRMRAKKLAEMGYIALAVDMYGDGKHVDQPEDARKLSTAAMANLTTARKRFEAALTVLNRRKEKDPQKTAAIGYCFGGGVVLQMARLGVDLKGVASFHGSLDTKVKAVPGKVKARVLICNGEADPLVTEPSIQGFREEMKNAGVGYDFINYPNAKHAFTNPDATALGEKFNLPIAYQKDADEDSWKRLRDFLAEVFAE